MAEGGLDKSGRTTLFPILALIFVLAVAVRVTATFFIAGQSALLVDVVAYRESAANILTIGHTGYPIHMPLYPLLIALAGPGIGQLAADILLSSLLAVVVGALTFEIFADRIAAIFAALMVACYPPLIFMSVVGLSEPLFIFLCCLAFLFWYRGDFLLADIAAVLAILTRPVFDPFAPVLVVLFAVLVHRLPWREVAKKLLAYAAVYCVLMAPWWVANYRHYGEFVRLTAGSGIVVYAGNNPLNKTGGGNQGVDYDTSGFEHISNLAERDRAMMKAGLDYIAQNPRHFFELAWLKFTRIWRRWPVHVGYSSLGVILITAGSFLPILLLGAVGMVVKRRMTRKLSPIYLYSLDYTAIHMVLVGTIRYRLPLEPFLIMFAAVPFAALWRRYVQARKDPVTT